MLDPTCSRKKTDPFMGLFFFLLCRAVCLIRLDLGLLNWYFPGYNDSSINRIWQDRQQDL